MAELEVQQMTIEEALQAAIATHTGNYKLMSALCGIESSGNSNAVSPTGVRGAFQITGSTFTALNPGKPYSIQNEIQADSAVRLMNKLLARYDGNQDLACIAYNSGPGVANKLKGKELTYENVAAAVAATHDKAWYGNPEATERKSKEAFNYFHKIGGSPGVAGSVGTKGSATHKQQDVTTGPTDENAKSNRTLPLAFSVDDVTPLTPLQVIQEGLDLAAWYDKDPGRPGGYVGNPHLRGIPSPAYFELRLNKSGSESLAGSDGRPIQIRLNVSLQSINTHSQHIVSREPTATGLMITFWGSQPDMIVGRGTTGSFINQFGLASLMSSNLTVLSSKWGLMIRNAYKDPELRTSLVGETGDKHEVFRVAAQDAFAEMLALFKNNGVTRFLPASWAYDFMSNTKRSTIDSAAYKTAASMVSPDSVWSPAAGATGFQMNARAGDVYTRGYVVFNYKGRSHFGYFKAFNFSANAATPFKWDFDFTFRVLKSFSPMFQSSTGMP